MEQVPRVLRRLYLRWGPRKPLSPAQGLLLFVLAMAVVTILRPHGTSFGDEAPGQQQSAGVQPRSLRSHFSTRGTPKPILRGASSAAYLPNPPTQKHSLLILDPGPDPTPTSGGVGGSAATSQLLWLLDPFLQPLRAHPDAVTISTLSGPTAVSIAAQFLVPPSDLPAVVYYPPMWDSGGGFKRAAVFVPSKSKGGPSDFPAWLKQHARMSLLLENDWDNHTDMCFYFIGMDGKEVQVSCPKPQKEVWQVVGLLDRFVARNQSTGVLLAEHIALFSGIFAVHPPGFCHYLVDRKCGMQQLPFPDDPVILDKRVQGEKQRLQLMVDQPARTPHFDSIGFKKRKCPEELFQALSGYLNASWDNLVLERKTPENIYSNQFEAPGLHATLPEAGWLKPRLFSIVQHELEQWIDHKTPLESTAMYGIRVYTTGSTLAMHCDRADTHIVSAIINVAQEVEQPWPLQIKDHSGKQYDVLMEPGDMVMYEGAACAHGRVKPLKGRYFANVFVHFKPKGHVVAAAGTKA